MSTSRHRSLEATLGFYDFGTRYVVYTGKESSHRRYTAIHERTHANIGCGSTFGAFQQFLAFLSFRGAPKMSSVGRTLLQLSLQEVIDLHEAAATYVEFATAEAADYSGLADMRASTPREYLAWKALYDKALDSSLPVRTRAGLAELISRDAMCTTIWADYEEVSDQKIGNFQHYLSDVNNSPRHRFRRALNYISTADQRLVFRNYLAVYDAYNLELREALASRDTPSRQKSFAIQGKLRSAFDNDSARIPGLEGGLATMSYLAQHSDRLIEGWKQYAATLGETFAYSMANTDIHAVDILDEGETIVFDPKPLSGLWPLSAVSAERFPYNEYVASVIEWKEEAPFLLSSSPERWLKKDQVYVRLLPLKNDMPSFFMHSSSVEELEVLLRKGLAGVLSSNARSKPLLTRKTDIAQITTVFVYWESFSRLLKETDVSNDCDLGFIGTDSDIIIAVVRCFDWNNIFLTDSDHVSLVIGELAGRVGNLRKLQLSEQESQTLRTIWRYGEHIL